MESKNPPMKTMSIARTCAAVLFFVLFIVAGLSHLVTSTEEIPDKAKFVYDMELKVFIPSPEIGTPAFFPVAGKFADVRDSLQSKWDGTTTWGEIKKKDGPFANYDLPKGPGWDRFVFYGSPVPLWKSLLFDVPSRWDEAGFWRY
jgi:hypothetical protein